MSIYEAVKIGDEIVIIHFFSREIVSQAEAKEMIKILRKIRKAKEEKERRVLEDLFWGSQRNAGIPECLTKEKPKQT